jgi:multidrug resistance efflux pump
MSNSLIIDLADCTEFRQTLQARPPRIVHGTALLLAALLGAAVLWAALTKADLVVRSSGRVRPVRPPVKVFNASRSDVFSASAGSRVREVHFRAGDTVRQGDVLIRLDTERLDNDILRRQRSIQAGEEELAKLSRLEKLSQKQFGAATAKAEAELAQALEEAAQAKDRQAADITLAEVDLASARDEERRLRALVLQRAATPADLVKATARLRETEEKVRKARLPIEQGRAAIARQALAVIQTDFAVRQEELAVKRAHKQGELEASRLELAGLELERKQAMLCAPMDGVVTTRDIKAGDLLEGGKAVLEIAEQNGFRFEAAVPSEEVAHLRVGMAARIRLDAYDYQKYGTLDGTVSFISPDSEMPEGQRGAVYTVRIDVTGDTLSRGSFQGRVKLGMTGQVEIVTDQESILLLLFKKIWQTISLG